MVKNGIEYRGVAEEAGTYYVLSGTHVPDFVPTGEVVYDPVSGEDYAVVVYTPED